MVGMQAYGGDESDVVSPKNNINSAEKSNSLLAESQQHLGDSIVEINEQQMKQNRANDNESCTGTPLSKLTTASNNNSRRSTIWGRNNVTSLLLCRFKKKKKFKCKKHQQ